MATSSDGCTATVGPMAWPGCSTEGGLRSAPAGVRPNWLVTLEVPGRRTGRVYSFPVVVAEYDGDRYLVAMLGEEAQLGTQRPFRRGSGRAAPRAP